MEMRLPVRCSIRRNFLSGIQVEFKQSPHQRSLRARLYWLQVPSFIMFCQLNRHLKASIHLYEVSQTLTYMVLCSHIRVAEALLYWWESTAELPSQDFASSVRKKSTIVAFCKAGCYDGKFISKKKWFDVLNQTKSSTCFKICFTLVCVWSCNLLFYRVCL